MILIDDKDQLAPDDYVIVTASTWKAIQGELMARPDLLRHIGPIQTWKFVVAGDDQPTTTASPSSKEAPE